MKKTFYILIVILAVHICFIPSEKVKGESVKSVAGIEISEENFPDEVLREILEKKDEDGDGFLSDKEIESIKSINLDKVELQDEEHGLDECMEMNETFMYGKPKGLTLTKEEKVKRYCTINLKGIDKLTYLSAITLGTGYIKGYGQKIYNLNLLYKMPKIIGLQFIGDSGIKKLQLYRFQNLKNLTLYSTDFDSINFGKKSKIEYICMIMCNIKKRLDISQLKKLKNFKVEFSVITDLKMGRKNKKIEKFYLTSDLDNIKKCKISKLDFSNMKNLKTVEINSWKKLKSIKFKNNNKLKKVKIINCPKLKNINIKNCKNAKKIFKKYF